jgi:hypothetical protein
MTNGKIIELLTALRDDVAQLKAEIELVPAVLEHRAMQRQFAQIRAEAELLALPAQQRNQNLVALGHDLGSFLRRQDAASVVRVLVEAPADVKEN